MYTDRKKENISRNMLVAIHQPIKNQQNKSGQKTHPSGFADRKTLEYFLFFFCSIVMILSFLTDRPGQGLHCLQFSLHPLDALL